MYLRTIIYLEDNTVGSQLTREERAYIAGFLDGDGSVMFQAKRRSDTKKGWRFMVTICFYQDTRHEAPLLWIRKKLGIGYVSQRNDGITEVRINGFKQVQRILSQLLPYVRFKKPQAEAICKACTILIKKSVRTVSTLLPQEKERLCHYLMQVQEHNYMTHRKKNIDELRLIVGLTP